MFIKTKLLVIFSQIVFLFIISSVNVFSNTILFEDNFDDGDDVEWTKEHNYGLPGVDTRNMWQVVDQKYGMNVTTPNTSGDSFAGDFNWTNYRFEFDMLPVTGTDKNFLFKYNPLYGFYEIHITGNKIYLTRAGVVEPLGIKTISIANGIEYKWQIDINKNHLIVKYKNISAVDYITIFDITESAQIPSGKIALRIGTGNTYPTKVLFDNVRVIDLNEPTPTPTPTPDPTIEPTPTPAPTPNLLNVPFYSQKDPIWANDKYDHAEKWAPKLHRSIQDWGCALTSAVMALRYHGFTKGPEGRDTNPLTLNEYLKSMHAYNRYGYIVWSGITNYAKATRDNGFVPSDTKLLEYSTRNYSFSAFTNLIDNQQLGIFKLTPNGTGSHFVVGTGYSTYPDNIIAIHDPIVAEYGNETIPGKYSWSSIKSMRTFTPSNTDLSYIWIYTDPDLPVTALKDGEPLPSDTLVCETEGIESGSLTSPLFQSCSISKPETGEYSVQVENSDGATTPVEIYLVDIDSRIKRLEMDGWSFISNPTIYLHFDKQNVSRSNVSRTLTESAFKELVMFLYQHSYISQSTHDRALLLIDQPIPSKHTLLSAKQLVLKDLDKRRNHPEILKIIQEISHSLFK